MRAPGESPLVLSEPWPRALSAGMIAIGVGVIVLTFSDLHRALWPLNLLTPFFAVIVGGACFVGFTLAAGGLQPRAKRWSFHDDRIEIDLQHLLHPIRRVVVLSGDVAMARLVEHDWDSREMSWSVHVELLDGTRLATPEIGSKPRAEAILGRDRGVPLIKASACGACSA